MTSTTPRVSAFRRTVGGVRDVLKIGGLDGGLGADVTFYVPPDALQQAYGGHPVSFHLFFRLRPAAGAMGRMWNMRMSQPMDASLSEYGGPYQARQ
jgi:hypothetical protein